MNVTKQYLVIICFAILYQSTAMLISQMNVNKQY